MCCIQQKQKACIGHIVIFFAYFLKHLSIALISDPWNILLHFFFPWDSGIQHKIVLFVIHNTLLKLWLSIWIQLFPLILFKFHYHFGLSLRFFQYINYFLLRKRYIISNFSRKFLPISIFANVLLTTSSNVCFSWVFSFVTICKFYPVYSVNFTSLKRSKQLQDMSLSARSYIHGPTWFLAQ